LKLESQIIVADCALLSTKNIQTLTDKGYQYILGGKIKNEAQDVKDEILSLKIEAEKPVEIANKYGRLIVSYSTKRQRRTLLTGKGDLIVLRRRSNQGSSKKKVLTTGGYNKYLVLEGEMNIKIDYEKFYNDKVWDGLKGYSTNTDLNAEQVIETYANLWLIEKAFRISKTDLKVRPIYHRVFKRIKAHICICFAAYAVYKELERCLNLNKIELSAEKSN
jgi:transposase